MTTEARLRRRAIAELIGAAVKAPSSHNTQPWTFRIGADRIELRADRTRALPMNDPHDRELTISCGAALLNCRVAARARGLDPLVEVLPDPEDRDLLATIELDDGPHPTRVELALQAAVDRRRTYREPFRDEPLQAGAVPALRAAADLEQARLRVVDDADTRSHLAALVSEGDRRQFHDPRWRRELARWMHPRRSGDGLPVGAVTGPLARMVVTYADIGRRIGGRDALLVESAPLLATISTPKDDAIGWIAAGQALERVLLTAASLGIQAGFVNQPCQVPDLRRELRELFPRSEWPQVVLRMGIPDGPVNPAPRRPIAHVLHG